MEGRGVRWLAFCAGLGTGYTLGLATYRWLTQHGDPQIITSLANSLQSLTAEVSNLRQALSEAGTQLRDIRRASVRSTRIASTVIKKEVGGESEKEEEDEEEVFYEVASLVRCAFFRILSTTIICSKCMCTFNVMLVA